MFQKSYMFTVKRPVLTLTGLDKEIPSVLFVNLSIEFSDYVYQYDKFIMVCLQYHLYWFT